MFTLTAVFAALKKTYKRN